MKFARWVFLLAGIYGALVVLPQFFLERRVGIDYPPLTRSTGVSRIQRW